MWTHNLRHTLRLFRREPGFAAAAVLTLALGIGVNTALFAVVHAVLLGPLPFDRADDLVVLRHRDLRSGLTKPDIAIGDFVDLRARQQSLESLAGVVGYPSTFFGPGEPVRVGGVMITPDALRALGVQPSLGRLLRDEDAREGAAPVVMVSYEFWRTQLGSDANVLARSIVLGSTRRMVVGVLPAGFRLLPMPESDVIVPQALPAAAPSQRKSGWIYGLGRLRPGVTIGQVQAELAGISQQLEREYPDQNRGSRYEAQSLRDALVGDSREPLLLLLAAAGFVLLIACANVGNLLLARALARQSELAVRVALGASRTRLGLHVLSEGLGLAFAGAAAGIVVARFTVPVLIALVPNVAVVPGLEHVGLGADVLLFACGAAVLSALVFSTVALVGAGSWERLALLAQRRGTMTASAARAASSLVVVEIGVAVVLLAGAGLTLRSFTKLLAVDPGFEPGGVITMELALPDGRYGSEEARRVFYERALRDIEAMPGVETVGAAMVTPLTGNNWTVPLQRVDRPLAPGARAPDVGWQLASRGYFEALKIPLRAGRLFEPGDATGPAAVIISEAAAARHFPGEQAVGHRISLGDVEAEIVGVVGSIRRASLQDDPREDLYFPFERVMSPQTTLFVRVNGDPVVVLPAVRAAVRRVDPQAVVDQTRTLAAIAEESAAVTRLATRLLSGFAAIAILLAAIGVYGVMSYRVRRRSRELGTRLALGASPHAITRLVLSQAAALAAAGVVVGTAVALAVGRTVSWLLYEVRPWDPIALTVAAALLVAATLGASYLPARRAGQVDPVSVLSAE